MPQFLAERIDPATGVAVLSIEESRHLAATFRARPGDRILVFDGQGTQAWAEVDRLGSGKATLRLLKILPPAAFCRSVVLFQGLPARPAWERILAAAVELGAFRIVPIISSRTSRPSRSWEGKKERWRSLAVAAAKQCLRPDIPRIEDPTPFEEAATQTKITAGIILAGPEIGSPLSAVVCDFSREEELVLAVGPEGGWSNEEIETAVSLGWKTASLGPLILRSETAATVALGTAVLLRSPAG